MFKKIPFVPSELDFVEEKRGFFNMVTKIRNTPVSSRMNMDALFNEKHPYWMPSVRENSMLHPAIYNDHLGRGSQHDIRDSFGVKWVFVPSAGGSMEDPSEAPLLEDVNEWRDKIVFPDIDSWDWAKAAEEEHIDMRYPCVFSFVNGFWFERLISFMRFMPAAMALIDDEQTESIKELFSAMSDFGCRLVDKFCEYWPGLDLIEVHDDWGSQNAPFFSQQVAQELFVPYMRRVTDRIHSWGRRVLLHSCGHNEDRVQCYIDAGFDFWAPQTMNNIGELYENYGDKIVLGVFPEETDLAQRSEEEQRAAARAFAEKYCKPGKPAILGNGANFRITPAFEEELYRYSREIYLAQN